MVAAVPGLKVAVRLDPADLKRAHTTDKGHGRIETRFISVRTKGTRNDKCTVVSDEPVGNQRLRRARRRTYRCGNPKLPARLDEVWPGVTAICRIERRRELKDRCSREVVYAITSLPVDKLAPQVLLQLSRDHWGIENSLFHVRDVTFGEDASRVRTRSAPEVMADLRNAILTLIRRTGEKPRAARQAYAARPKAAIRLVLRS